MSAIVLLAGGVLMTSCAIPVKRGEVTHHVILGFGIVSNYKGTNYPVAVNRVQSVGVHVSDQPGLKVGIGAASSVGVMVATNAEDVRIEVTAKPFSLLKVDAISVKTTKPKTNEEMQNEK